MGISMKPGKRGGRVREQPLHVPLHERRQVPDCGEATAGDARSPEVLLRRERDVQDPEHHDERATFVAADMNAVTGVGEPWYTSGVHMWNGAAEALKPSPVSTIASPTTSIGSFRRSPAPAAPIWGNDSLGRTEHERRAEQQDRRAERADDQILEAGLERGLEVDVDGAEDVEAERKPLEPEEQRHQVVRLHHERHPGDSCREEREVLARVILLGRSDQATKTLSRPTAARMHCANAASRSRRAAVPTRSCASGVFQKTQLAAMSMPMNPSPTTAAASAGAGPA